MYWIANLFNRGPRRVNHASASFDNHIYVFGGYSSELSVNELRKPSPIDVHVLNPVTLYWVKRSLPTENDEQYQSTPHFRYGHTCVTNETDGLIYLWGGRADWYGRLVPLCNKLFSYNPKLHKWSIVNVTGYMPHGRDGHSACVNRNRMYIFGGFVQTIEQFSNDICEFNFETSVWTPIVPKTDVMPHWRDFHTATVVDDKMYIFGGRMDSGGSRYSGYSFYCNRIYSFDFIKQNWTKIELTDKTYVPPGRRSHSAIAYKGKILCFGGFDESRLEHYKDLFEFDIEKSKWTELKVAGKYPSKRRRHGCCLINDSLYFFGGTGPKELNEENNDTNNSTDPAHRNQLDVLRRQLVNYQNFINLLHINDNNNENEQQDHQQQNQANGNLSDDEIEDTQLNEHDRKLQSKSDLHILKLGIPSLQDFCRLVIFKHKLNYQNKNLPELIVKEIRYFSSG